LCVTGNLKFDRPIPETGPHIRQQCLVENHLPEGTWLVAGSTHPGEEEIILRIYQKLLPRFPDLHLLVAPRNRQRFDAVWKLIERTRVPAAAKSRITPHTHPRIFLLDCLGELDRFYELADIAFVGKSLPVPGEGGGHNLLEPAARGKPVLFGPRMHNFSAIARLMTETGAGCRVHDAAELEKTLIDLLSDPQRMTVMGAAAKRAAAAHHGALEKTVGLIRTAMTEHSGGRG
jgi:3-deoxy-D-manno-octulosonic-acid transferase